MHVQSIVQKIIWYLHVLEMLHFLNAKHSATSWFWLILGNDVEVICGEWETGDKPYPTSGEDYNIVLQINSIVRHPGKCQYSTMLNQHRKCHKSEIETLSE